MTRSLLRSLGRTAWLPLVVAPLTVMAQPAAQGAVPDTRPAAAPAFFSFAGPDHARFAAPRAVAGSSRLVTLRTSLLPARAEGQRIGFDIGTNRAVTGRIEQVDHEASYSAWTGSLPGVAQGTFAIVKSGSIYRAEVISPRDGAYQISQASGDHYWLTALAPPPAAGGRDEAPAPVSKAHATRTATGHHHHGHHKHHGKSKVTVMFAYTPGALALAGSTAALEADAALTLSQTNQALANSGDKVKMKYKGMVSTPDAESSDPVGDAFAISHAHDGRFDALQKKRRHHKADIIHLFTDLANGYITGGGLVPLEPRYANPSAGASVSNLPGLPYLVTTHELGHNLGADHIDYPGVGHVSHVPYAYGFYNVPGNYITMMGYYNPCADAGDNNCVRIPWFSSPTNTANGQPLGVNKYNNNSKVIAKTAPRVAKYLP